MNNNTVNRFNNYRKYSPLCNYLKFYLFLKIIFYFRLKIFLFLKLKETYSLQQNNNSPLVSKQRMN